MLFSKSWMQSLLETDKVCQAWTSLGFREKKTFQRVAKAQDTRYRN